MSSEYKRCTACRKVKNTEKEFYKCQGKPRSECKQCAIKRNVQYQRRVKAWASRFVDNDQSKSYMADYYAKNKEKFAEYRRKFRERNPDYNREYSRKYKQKKNARIVKTPA